ncbi:MAG: hypothetical protein ACRDJP_11765, partial [Actinomycetota bacterium]
MADADAALSELGPVTVVGRGVGAYVALLIAGARPELVRGAVLADGPGLAGGGGKPSSPTVPAVDTSAPGPPDPYALVDLSRDLRPPDYAATFVRQTNQLSDLEWPIHVAAVGRPDWLAAVVAEPGVREASMSDAISYYGQENRPCRNKTDMKSARFMIPFLVASVVTMGPAVAHHSESEEPLSPTEGGPWTGLSSGEGAWTFIRNFPANPGSDLELFRRNGMVFSSSGTLGQGSAGHVGQRFLQLVDAEGNVAPEWVADHGSAACPASNPTGTTGLQHDVQITPAADPQLAIDATDATGRCHDPDGGGLELIDISGIGRDDGAPVQEVHLTRHDGTSHNVTVDAMRPWLVYNSNTDGGRPWIDVLDIRTCLDQEPAGAATSAMGAAKRLAKGQAEKLAVEALTVEQKQERCRPVVYRMPFEAEWTSPKLTDGTLGTPSGCHDITAREGRLYCAAVSGTVVLDVTGLTDGSGNVRGTPLPCEVVDGADTTAKVTDCDLGDTSADSDIQAWQDAGSPRAEGWSMVTFINHAGIEGPVPNNNVLVPSDEEISISHEADPTPDGKWLFVTDERGGGVVPPGSSCAPGVDNPVGNGGMHVYDISDPANPEPALTPEGERAVFFGSNQLPAATFCTIHVIEHLPDEQRLVMAWYSQGIKIVDYEIDENGRWTFEQVAAFTLPGAETWAAEHFKIVDNPDGTRTYYFLASDIARGIDIVSYTGAPAGSDVDTEAAPAAAGVPALSLRGPAFAAASLVLPQA